MQYNSLEPLIIKDSKETGPGFTTTILRYYILELNMTKVLKIIPSACQEKKKLTRIFERVWRPVEQTTSYKTITLRFLLSRTSRLFPFRKRELYTDQFRF